jgi:PAS domain S-box-containing protein
MPPKSDLTNPLEESLEASEERFRAAFAQSVTGMAITDLDGVLQRVNKAFCRIVGHPAEEILGRTSREFTHPEDWEKSTEAIRQIRAGAVTSTSYDKRYVRNDGAAVWTRVNLSLVRGANGQPESLIATVDDITEQRRTQAELQEREERLRLIFESITDHAILTLDPAGIVTSWNTGAERIFGYRATEIMGKPSDVLWTDADRENRGPQKERQTALENGSAIDERWHLRKDGTRFFASGVMRPILDSRGEARGFTKICRDVTAQQCRERTRRGARRGRSDDRGGAGAAGGSLSAVALVSGGAARPGARVRVGERALLPDRRPPRDAGEERSGGAPGN